MRIIFYDKDGDSLERQSDYALDCEGYVVCWNESGGWTREFCEDITFIISNQEDN